MNLSSAGRPAHTSVAALNAAAVQAGLALGCVYSSADELDAAIIAARRDAGVYGPRRRAPVWMAVAAGIATLTLIIILI